MATEEGQTADWFSKCRELEAENATLKARCDRLDGLLRRVYDYRGYEWGEKGSQLEMGLSIDINAALADEEGDRGYGLHDAAKDG